VGQGRGVVEPVIMCKIVPTYATNVSSVLYLHIYQRIFEFSTVPSFQVPRQTELLCLCFKISTNSPEHVSAARVTPWTVTVNTVSPTCCYFHNIGGNKYD